MFITFKGRSKWVKSFSHFLLDTVFLNSSFTRCDCKLSAPSKKKKKGVTWQQNSCSTSSWKLNLQPQVFSQTTICSDCCGTAALRRYHVCFVLVCLYSACAFTFHQMNSDGACEPFKFRDRTPLKLDVVLSKKTSLFRFQKRIFFLC